MTTFADKLEDVNSIEEAEALFREYISPVYPSLSLGNWTVGREKKSNRAWAAIGEELSGKTFYVDWEIGYADASIETKDPEPDDCEEEPDESEESQSESDHWMTAIHEIFFEIDFDELAPDGLPWIISVEHHPSDGFTLSSMVNDYLFRRRFIDYSYKEARTEFVRLFSHSTDVPF